MSIQIMVKLPATYVHLVNLNGPHFSVKLSTEDGTSSENHKVQISYISSALEASNIKLSFPEDYKAKWFVDSLHRLFKPIANPNDKHTRAVFTLRNAISPRSFSDENISPFVVNKYLNEMLNFFKESFDKGYFGNTQDNASEVNETLDYYKERITHVLFSDYHFNTKQKDFFVGRLDSLRKRFDAYQNSVTNPPQPAKRTGLDKYMP